MAEPVVNKADRERWYWFETRYRKYIGKCFTSEAEIKRTFVCEIKHCLVTVQAILQEPGTR